MLERLVNHSLFYFLNGYSGYHQIPIHPDDQSKTTFTCPLELMLIEECLLDYVMP
jgi:hypothetical protein